MRIHQRPSTFQVESSYKLASWQAVVSAQQGTVVTCSRSWKWGGWRSSRPDRGSLWLGTALPGQLHEVPQLMASQGLALSHCQPPHFSASWGRFLPGDCQSLACVLKMMLRVGASGTNRCNGNQLLEPSGRVAKVADPGQAQLQIAAPVNGDKPHTDRQAGHVLLSGNTVRYLKHPAAVTCQRPDAEDGAQSGHHAAAARNSLGMGRLEVLAPPLQLQHSLCFAQTPICRLHTAGMKLCLHTAVGTFTAERPATGSAKGPPSGCRQHPGQGWTGCLASGCQAQTLQACALSAARSLSMLLCSQTPDGAGWAPFVAGQQGRSRAHIAIEAAYIEWTWSCYAQATKLQMEAGEAMTGRSLRSCRACSHTEAHLQALQGVQQSLPLHGQNPAYSRPPALQGLRPPAAVFGLPLLPRCLLQPALELLPPHRLLLPLLHSLHAHALRARGTAC